MKKIALSSLILLLVVRSFAQISPPGLGNAHTAEWLALGVRQKLDTLEGKGWQSMSYVGLGRLSNPDNYNPFFKPAILVINQEFYHQFHNRWQYSFALSYRSQDKYLDKPPYEHDTPDSKQEFRVYGRFSSILKVAGIRIVPTVRQELRKFYTPDFHNPTENYQLRSRFRLQLTANLDARKVHKITASSEQLFSISKEGNPKGWTDFNYRESRFAFYYSLSPKSIPLTFNLGYMNNLVHSKTSFDVHYLAFDVTIENPSKFLHPHKKGHHAI